jgi:hypothetical protein
MSSALVFSNSYSTSKKKNVVSSPQYISVVTRFFRELIFVGGFDEAGLDKNEGRFDFEEVTLERELPPPGFQDADVGFDVELRRVRKRRADLRRKRLTS